MSTKNMNIDLFARVYKKIQENPEGSHMRKFCGTTRCIGGWTVYLAKNEDSPDYLGWIETTVSLLKAPRKIVSRLCIGKWKEFYGKELPFEDPAAGPEEMLGAMRAFVAYYYPHQLAEFKQLIAQRELSKEEEEAVLMLLHPPYPSVDHINSHLNRNFDGKQEARLSEPAEFGVIDGRGTTRE